MVEGTPGKPYGGLLAHFNIVEANMQYRRAEASTLLKDGEVIMSITNFPRFVLNNKKYFYFNSLNKIDSSCSKHG